MTPIEIFFENNSIKPTNTHNNTYTLEKDNYQTLFRILHINKSHIPGDNNSYRIQIKFQHIKEFIDNNILLIGYSEEFNCFIVVDPNSVLNKRFKSNSSINFQLSFLDLISTFQIIYPKHNDNNSPLYLNSNILIQFLQFHNNKKPTSFANYENILDDFYEEIVFKVVNNDVPKIQPYSRSLEYISQFSKDSKYVLSHLENNLFRRGIRNKHNTILPIEIFTLLSTEHKKLALSSNYLGQDNFNLIHSILKSVNSTDFFLINKSSIKFRNKIEFYNLCISNYLRYSKDNISTGNDIDNHLSNLLPTYKDKFEIWNTVYYRFKKRILAGKYKKEFYFYDSYDNSILDISTSHNGYNNYLEEKVIDGKHICDIYFAIQSMYSFSNVYLFYKHLNRILHSKNLKYHQGYCYTTVISNKYDEIVLRKIDDLLSSLAENKIEFKKDFIEIMNRSKLFNYLITVFETETTDDSINIYFELEYNEQFPFDHGGILCRSKNESIGLFPLLFYQTLYNLNLPIYFVSQRNIYYLSNKSSKPVIKSISL